MVSGTEQQLRVLGRRPSLKQRGTCQPQNIYWPRESEWASLLRAVAAAGGGRRLPVAVLRRVLRLRPRWQESAELDGACGEGGG